MKLTKNTWHYNAYQLLTGKKPNNNFCDYFWTLLINVLLFPLTIPFSLIAILYSLISKDSRKKLEGKDGEFYLVEKKLTFKEKYINNINIPLFAKIFISFKGKYCPKIEWKD